MSELTKREFWSLLDEAGREFMRELKAIAPELELVAAQRGRHEHRGVIPHTGWHNELKRWTRRGGELWRRK